MPTSVVTGGAGFLGSHLCEYLVERGHLLSASGGRLGRFDVHSRSYWVPLLGVVGALLAVPTAAIMQIMVREYLNYRDDS